MAVQTTIKTRRDTSANWLSVNPVLAAGEAGLETDTGLLKYGNGTSAWDALNYQSVSRVVQPVKNSSGASIPKGSVVYISGANGDNALISLADADSESTSSKTLGLTGATAANGATVDVIAEGIISGINTASATAGQSVWLSSTAGQFVFNAPPAKPAHSVYLGVVLRAHATQGEILIKVQNGYELNELHDVNAGSPSTGDALVWDGTSWVNQQVDVSGAIDAHNSDTTSVHGIADTSLLATKSYADNAAATAAAAIVDSAPGTLDTLNELAAALGDDANYATTVTNALAAKAPNVSAELTTPEIVSGNLKFSNGTSNGIELEYTDSGSNPIVISQTDLSALVDINNNATIQQQLNSKASGAVYYNSDKSSTATNAVIVGAQNVSLAPTDSSLTVGSSAGALGAGLSFAVLNGETSRGASAYIRTNGSSTTAPIDNKTILLEGAGGGAIHIVEIDVAVWVYGDSKNSIASGSKSWKWSGSVHIEGNTNSSGPAVATLIGSSITNVSETATPSMTGFDFAVSLGTDANSGSLDGAIPLRVEVIHPSGAPSSANAIWIASAKTVSRAWV